MLLVAADARVHSPAGTGVAVRPSLAFQRPRRIANAYSYCDAIDGRAQPRPAPATRISSS